MMAIVVARVFFSIRCQRWFVRRLLHIASARFSSHERKSFGAFLVLEERPIMGRVYGGWIVCRIPWAAVLVQEGGDASSSYLGGESVQCSKHKWVNGSSRALNIIREGE